MKDKLLQIINHYGVMKQLKYIHTEYFELDEAIIDYMVRTENVPKNSEPCTSKEHIVEEIADVMVMLKQFQYYYGIEDSEIEEIMKYKVDRQIERMRGEENGNI